MPAARRWRWRLSAGSMELNYTLTSAADALLTPDFRLQLISPGTFHLAISVGASGDTCVRTLPGNDAAVFVAEMMGNDSYQLSPGKSVLFGGGKISGATVAPQGCGCPEPGRRHGCPSWRKLLPGRRHRAAAPRPQYPPPEQQITQPQPAETDSRGGGRADCGGASGGRTARLSIRGEQAEQDLYGSVSRLSLSTDNSTLALALLPQVSGPAAATGPGGQKKSGFLHWLGHRVWAVKKAERSCTIFWLSPW